MHYNQYDNSTTDNTIEVLIILCYFSLFLSRVLSWIFLADFRKRLQCLIQLPLHLTGLIDVIYILSDSLCSKPHNSIRFYISNILSLFCFPAYVILVILIAFIYQGIEKEIITVLLMLSSINEFFVFYVFGIKTAGKINNKTIFYSIVQNFEFMCSLSFLGLIIINVRFNLTYLIIYFAVIFVLTILLPCATDTYFVNGHKLNGFLKMVYLFCFWICTYQPCLDKIDFNKKIFASISYGNNRFLVIVKFLFYQSAYWFFVNFKEQIYEQVGDSSQLQGLFVIASISQLKLVFDIVFSVSKQILSKNDEIAITNNVQLDNLIKSAKENKEQYNNLKVITINIFPTIKNSEASKIFYLSMCLMKNCQIVINNSNNGRFFYNEDTNSQIVKLDDIKFPSYTEFMELCEENKIMPGIEFLTMHITCLTAQETKQIYSFLKIIHSSNILHYNIKHDQTNKKLNEPIQLYQNEQLRGIMQFLIFKTYAAQFIPINPTLVLYDLQSD